MTRRTLRNDPVAARGRAGPQPHQTTGSHLHQRQSAPGAVDEAGRHDHGDPHRTTRSTTQSQEEYDRGGERPSKSQLKREMSALQDLGEQLLRLPPAKLRRLPIPEQLIEAVELAQRIANSREGLRRQRQFIGRLMREIDAAPLRDALSEGGARHRGEVATMHAAEHWRTRLLEEPAALAEFVALHPSLAGELPPLIEQVHAERGKAQPGRRYRELFRVLRDALGEPASP